METEMRGLGHSWGSIQKLTEDRELWRSVDAALSAIVGLTGSERVWISSENLAILETQGHMHPPDVSEL